jgi:Protein of unknown function DUF262
LQYDEKDSKVVQDLAGQLNTERRSVSFDVYDFAVKQLVDFVEDKTIDIAPEYQRQFVWDGKRQSQFIESVFLGIPIPSLFMATNTDATWEVIDGVQRLSTLVHFCGSQELRKRLNLSSELRLTELEKLDGFNGTTFSELSQAIKTSFITRPIRITVLNDKSDRKVRFDLFQRLNTGGVILQDQEIRNCIYRGPFKDFLKEMSISKNFRSVAKVKKSAEHNGTREEMVLRFFAYLENYRAFDHSVVGFLNDFMQKNATRNDFSKMRSVFEETFSFLQTELPDGVVRGEGRSISPMNLYEAIAVGTGLVVKGASIPKRGVVAKLLNDGKLKEFTTGATNSKARVRDRIEFVRDKLLPKQYG